MEAPISRLIVGFIVIIFGILRIWVETYVLFRRVLFPIFGIIDTLVNNLNLVRPTSWKMKRNRSDQSANFVLSHCVACRISQLRFSSQTAKFRFPTYDFWSWRTEEWRVRRWSILLFALDSQNCIKIFTNAEFLDLSGYPLFDRFVPVIFHDFSYRKSWDLGIWMAIETRELWIPWWLFRKRRYSVILRHDWLTQSTVRLRWLTDWDSRLLLHFFTRRIMNLWILFLDSRRNS